MADLYRVLQVDPAADAEVVEAAYRRLARKFHPDVSHRPDADERIRELNAAYDVLGDPLRRAAYDLARAPILPPRRPQIRVVSPRPRPLGRAAAPTLGVGPPPAAAPRVAGSEAAPGARRPPTRPVLAATMAGLAASVALAALSAQLFSAALAPPDGAAAKAVVVVSSPREEPTAEDPTPRRATPTPSSWPPPLYVVEPVEPTTPPPIDLFSKLVGAARQATRRLDGPTPPARPYNPSVP